MDVFTLPSTEEDAVAFLQGKGILHQRKQCRKYHEMKLYFGQETFWKCNKCRTKVNLRVGNWLVGSRLSFVTVIRVIYCWAYEYTAGKFCKRELGMGENTTVDWSMYCREVCVDALLRLPTTKIGGVGRIVEIDESMFTRRKNNTGRVLPPKWIFGGICRLVYFCRFYAL